MNNPTPSSEEDYHTHPEKYKGFKVFLTTRSPFDGDMATIRFAADNTYCFCSSLDIRALEVFMDAWANDNIAYISGADRDDLLEMWQEGKDAGFIADTIKIQQRDPASLESEISPERREAIKLHQDKIRGRLAGRVRDQYHREYGRTKEDAQREKAEIRQLLATTKIQ